MKLFFCFRKSRRTALLIAINVLAVVVFSCNSMHSRERSLTVDEVNTLHQLCDKLHVPSVDQKMMMVIPAEGCTHCIKKALTFTMVNKDIYKDKLTVVISGYSPEFYYLLADRFAIDSVNTPMDTKSLFVENEFVRFSPVLFKTAGTHTVAVELRTDDLHAELTRAGIVYPE